jgi:3,4-dihydroxy 2-butanone 4-phosphate synthase/GTP cyclohydrolase II
VKPNLFTIVHDALAALSAGRMILIVDVERENEGDVCVAAERCTPEAINFMATFCRGLICMPIIGPRLDELRLPLMIAPEGGEQATNFAVSVDARDGVTSGISAQDRARTVRALIDRSTSPEDLIRPGHIFPLRYTEGGVLKRAGHTEAAVDLARLAGLYPAAVICEVMNENGSMMRPGEMDEFARRHELTVVNVAQIVEYRRRTEPPAAPSTTPRKSRREIEPPAEQAPEVEQAQPQ